MPLLTTLVRYVLSFCLIVFSTNVASETLRLAVASNFDPAMTALAKRFKARTGHTLLLSVGSTGKHYAQIIHGAPFDIFFAADIKRPALLEQQRIAVPNTRFTYAIGKIVLWSPRQGYVDAKGAVLETGNFRRLAMANPKLAPYGSAARQVLKNRQQWSALTPRIVRGENIAQTYQFVKTGNAELGFVALSQIKRPGHPPTGSYWSIPLTAYPPIKQQAVLINDSATARQFLAFMRTHEALNIIHEYGYDTP